MSGYGARHPRCGRQVPKGAPNPTYRRRAQQGLRAGIEPIRHVILNPDETIGL
jgi:hypothetical protein